MVSNVVSMPHVSTVNWGPLPVTRNQTPGPACEIPLQLAAMIRDEPADDDGTGPEADLVGGEFAIGADNFLQEERRVPEKSAWEGMEAKWPAAYGVLERSALPTSSDLPRSARDIATA